MSTSSTEVRPDAPTMPVEPGDHERLSHYVDSNEMLEGMFNGTPCTALCGKVWVPTRDGKKFPVCPECKDIYEAMPPEENKIV